MINYDKIFIIKVEMIEENYASLVNYNYTVKLPFILKQNKSFINSI